MSANIWTDQIECIKGAKKVKFLCILLLAIKKNGSVVSYNLLPFPFFDFGCKGNDYFYKFQIIKSFSFSGVFA